MRGSGQRAADSGQDRRSPARCPLSAARYHSPVRPKLAAALAIVAAALASVVFFFYFRDNFSTHYPVKVISAAVWRAGEIPWWNFHAGGGQPLAGNPNTLSFYPDNVLYLVLPAHVAFNLHFVLHLIGAWLATSFAVSSARRCSVATSGTISLSSPSASASGASISRALKIKSYRLLACGSGSFAASGFGSASRKG